MTPPDDEALQRAFRALARHDARHAPSLQTLQTPRANRTAWRVLVPVGSSIALAACVLLGITGVLQKRDESSAMVSAAPPLPTSMPELAPVPSAAAVDVAPDAAAILVRKDELGLDEKQSKTLHRLQRELDREAEPLRQARRATQEQLTRALGTVPIDTVQVTRYGAELRSLDLRIEALERAHVARVHEVLTARQRELLGVAHDAGATDGGR